MTDKFAAAERTETTHTIGKLTIDTTQFFPKLTDDVLLTNGKIFICNRKGLVISSLYLKDQIALVGQGLYGDKSNLAFKHIWEVDSEFGFEAVQPGDFGSDDVLVENCLAKMVIYSAWGWEWCWGKF